jgi:hypothetical protein
MYKISLPTSCRIARKAQSHSRTTEKNGLTPPSIYTILSVRATHVSISIYLYTNTNIKYSDVIHPYNPSHAYEPHGFLFFSIRTETSPRTTVATRALHRNTGDDDLNGALKGGSARCPSWSDSLPHRGARAGGGGGRIPVRARTDAHLARQRHAALPRRRWAFSGRTRSLWSAKHWADRSAAERDELHPKDRNGEPERGGVNGS